ncbi:MAG: uracil-DNA glycosylase [Phycisphaerales bacterium]|nr:uracil-DNA glycosylase [Phycisphaerales bacterium]
MQDQNAKFGAVLRQHAHTTRLFGVDFIPIGRGVAPSAAPAVAKAPQPPASAGEAPAVPSKTAKRTASGRSGASGDPAAALQKIRELYELDAPHASFVTEFQNIVFGEGSPSARLMFVGEAPGAEEDKTGRPFVGRAGQLLDKMIEAMGLKREEVYIANVLKTRPPKNATPTTEESRLCAPYLYAQIGAIRPEFIVTLGLPSTRLLLDSTEAMARLRGRWHEFAVPEALPPKLAEVISPLGGVGHKVRVMPTYHPAFLLRQYTTENRAKVWADLRMVVDEMG